MKIKVIISEKELKRAHIGQFDHVYPEIMPKGSYPVCRVTFSGIEWVLFQTASTIVKMSLSNYINTGIDRHFGEFRKIPKVIL